MAQQAQLDVGVAGFGRMGLRWCKTLINRTPRARVVAICTSDERELESARKEYSGSGIELYSSYDKMLEHSGLGAVWVATSTDVHGSMTLSAIQKGLHVMCEKPVSTDIDEAKRVIQAAKDHPELKIMAGFSRRFDASYRDAKSKIVTQDAIGKPYIVRSQTCDLLDHTGFFVRYAARNGGMFVDCCIHDIDLSLYYFDDPIPKAVWAVGTIAHHPELKDLNDVDNGVGVVEYWGGKIAYFYCSRTMAHGHDVCTEIVGTNGKIMVNVIPRLNNVVVASEKGLTNEVQPEYWQRFEDAFATEANEFVNAVLDNKPVPLPLGIGLKSLEIGWALQDALLTNNVVRFDESGKRISS